jgi:hypothetical protein
MADTA